VIIGRFRREGGGFTGTLKTLGMQLDGVRFEPRDKGANYVVHGPGSSEFGAGWVKSGEFGEYVSAKLDCPTLPEPINATMKLTPTDDGVFLLRWQRREPSRRNGGGKHGGGDNGAV
jgi:uncharacterized protein (DUF736 family)